MEQRIRAGQKALVEVFPLKAKPKRFSGRITKVYESGAFEVKDSNGGLCFCKRNELLKTF